METESHRTGMQRFNGLKNLLKIVIKSLKTDLPNKELPGSFY
ncbi:MAG: hypothetical protein ABIJ59_11430 [Pseudomonadota bacterium]